MVKATGIIRKIDNLGRMVVPKEIRRTLGWDVGQPIEIFVDDEAVICKSYQPGCVFCDSLTDLVEFKGRLVCKRCIRGMK